MLQSSSTLAQSLLRRVIDTVRYGRIIYAAVRSRDGQEVFGLVLLTERHGGVLYTKPISEDMGPVEDRCPTHIIDQLTEPSNQHAREWRQRCRARLTKPCQRQARLGGSNVARGPTSHRARPQVA